VPGKYLTISTNGEGNIFGDHATYPNEDFISIAIVPQFAGIHHFYEGQNFQQWTSDNSKALMKVIPLPCFS